MKTTRTAAAHCPGCGHEVTAATTTHFASPAPGDLAVCVRCGALNEYGDGMQLAPFDESQLDDETRAEVALMRVSLGLPAVASDAVAMDATMGVLWERLKLSGMAERQCPCGTIFLTRGDSKLCPPCAERLS